MPIKPICIEIKINFKFSFLLNGFLIVETTSKLRHTDSSISERIDELYPIT